jgi:hypothetical protein
MAATGGRRSRGPAGLAEQLVHDRQSRHLGRWQARIWSTHEQFGHPARHAPPVHTQGSLLDPLNLLHILDDIGACDHPS